MNRTSVLGRKLIYLSVLVLMLLPLYLLGQPAGGGSDAGGLLTKMRDDFNIAESDLGEISPASQTMKLASLGLRGVAATLLWNKAHEYRVTHEWDRLKAAVNNITLLQPHSDKVWEFQAHNLAFNVSTEFDDYRQRYEMVREGTEFLQRGVRQNHNATRLIWYTGWFYGQKMGMSDERKQFRRLFADDKVLHEALMDEDIAVDSPEARGPLGKPDNWLVGRLWLYKGYDLVDTGVKIRRQTPLNYYETGPKWRIKHAEAIEKEGILDDRAQTRWQMAAEDWAAFGDRAIPTTSPFTIKLGRIDELLRQRHERFEEFKEVTGEAYTRARQKMIDDLPADLKTVIEKPEDQRSENDLAVLPMIESQIMPNLSDVAKDSDPKVRLRAISIAAEIVDLDERGRKTDGYRNQINYPYWKTLAQAEQEERTVRARRLIFEAEQANEKADLDREIELYEQAFAVWAEIFDDYPILTIDDSADDLYESIRRYMIAIDSQEFPENFPLETFVMTMNEAGHAGSRSYVQIRESMEQAAEERRKELEAEEQRREQEAAEAEKQEQSKEEEGEKESDETDSQEGNKEESDDTADSDDSAPSDDKGDEDSQPVENDSPTSDDDDSPATGDDKDKEVEP